MPGRLLGTLVAGLGVNSRVYQRISKQQVPTSVIMQALIVDELRLIVYMLNTDKSKTRPESIAERFFEADEPEQMGFMTPEEFEEARAALLGEINGRSGTR